MPRKHRTDFGFELTEAEEAWLERQANDAPIPDQVLRDAATLLRAGRKARLATESKQQPGRGEAPAD